MMKMMKRLGEFPFDDLEEVPYYQAMIESAKSFLASEKCPREPDDVYLGTDNNICFKWQESGILKVLEVLGPGLGKMMTTWPIEENKSAHFEKIKWGE